MCVSNKSLFVELVRSLQADISGILFSVSFYLLYRCLEPAMLCTGTIADKSYGLLYLLPGGIVCDRRY